MGHLQRLLAPPYTPSQLLPSKSCFNPERFTTHEIFTAQTTASLASRLTPSILSYSSSPPSLHSLLSGIHLHMVPTTTSRKPHAFESDHQSRNIEDTAPTPAKGADRNEYQTPASTPRSCGYLTIDGRCERVSCVAGLRGWLF
jgi:hypothetical protein